MNRINENTAGEGGVQGANTENLIGATVQAPPSLGNIADLMASNPLQATQARRCPLVVTLPLSRPPASEVQP